MSQVSYDKQITALLVIDPYNDFISDGGKVWDRLKAVAEATAVSPICCKFSMRHGRRAFVFSMRRIRRARRLHLR